MDTLSLLLTSHFRSSLHSKPKPKPLLSPSPLPSISLSYIQGITDHISNILAKQNIRTYLKLYKTLKQMFKTVKDRLDPMHSQGFYQIPCSFGKSYIGKMGQSIQTRLKEHMADTHHNRISKSAIAEHSFNSKHLTCFDQSRLLASTSHYLSKLIREALEIEKNANNFNRENGYKLSHSWKPLIQHLSHSKSKT